MTDQMQSFSAGEALDAMGLARADLAAKMSEGSWRYDLTYSALAGLIVGGQALPLGWSGGASLLGAGALSLLARDWARKKGVWVCGVTPRRARWVSLGLGIVIAALCAWVFFVTYRGGSRWVAAPAALVAAGCALAGSRLWRRVFLIDLKDGLAGPRMSLGLLVGLGGCAILGAGGAFLLQADSVVVGWLVGVGIGMMGMAGAMMVRRRFRPASAL